MSIKTAKFQILRPLDCDWKTFTDALYDVQYKNAKIMNFCMIQQYLHQDRREQFKRATGCYPTKEEMPRPYLYHDLRAMFPDIRSNNIQQANRIAELKWQQDRKDCYYKQDKSLSTFRKSAPIPIHQQAWSIDHTKEGYTLKFSLYSRKHKGKASYAVQLYTKKQNKSFLAILNRLMSGQYKKSMIKIQKHAHQPKWFVLFVYEPQTEIVPLDPNKVLGVDLGITYSFWGTTTKGQQINADGMEIVKFRQTIRQRRRSIQNQGPYSGRGGHGRKRMLRPTRSLSDKERLFRDARYHQYSRRIVDFAVKTGCGVIQMKNPDSLRPPKDGTDSYLCALLADWAVCDLMEKIKMKATEKGIEVHEVNPAYTSLRCFQCGHIAEANRPEWHRFHCEKCGYDTHADHNASQNLTIFGIDEMIAEKIASGEVMKKSQDPLEKEEK